MASEVLECSLIPLHRKLLLVTMAEYKLEVTTGNMTNAGTFDCIFVTLVGTEGESERTELNNFGFDFKTGMVSC